MCLWINNILEVFPNITLEIQTVKFSALIIFCRDTMLLKDSLKKLDERGLLSIVALYHVFILLFDFYLNLSCLDTRLVSILLRLFSFLIIRVVI